MKRDSRLSLSLHTLLHMADATGPMTSDAMAERAGTHPVVVRRMLSGLREAGLVRSEKGHGGGWALMRAPAQITLGDVYDALGAPTIFAMGAHTESPGCLVEQAVNRAVSHAFDEAEALLDQRFRQVTLADLAADVRHHLPKATKRKGHDHA